MSLEIKSKLQSLLTAANNTTGESDATLTDAVQTLVDGYGQGGEGGGTEVTAISSALNATACRALLFPGAVDNHLYVAVLKSPVSEAKVSDQLEFLFSVGPGGTNGGGVRWRNNAHGTFQMYSSYDAKIQTGDVYLCYDYPLV